MGAGATICKSTGKLAFSKADKATAAKLERNRCKGDSNVL